MEQFDRWLVKKYLSLDKTIKLMQMKHQLLEGNFYQQSMATRTEYTRLGIVVVGFRVESHVVDILIL